MASPPRVEGATATAAAAVDVLLLLGRLKQLPRTGWVLSGVPPPVESIAAHMYRMAVGATLLTTASGTPDTSPASLMAICLAHDMAEAIVGDVAPSDGMPAVEKHAREAAAYDVIAELMARAGAPAEGDAWRARFSLYEAGTSTAAHYVKDIDKLDMILTALEYESAHPELDLSDYFASTAGRFHSVEVRGWAEEVVRRRRAMLAARAAGATLEEVTALVSGGLPPLQRGAAVAPHIVAACAPHPTAWRDGFICGVAAAAAAVLAAFGMVQGRRLWR